MTDLNNVVLENQVNNEESLLRKNVVINGKTKAMIIALPKNYQMEQPKNKGKLLESLDKDKMFEVIYNFAHPKPFIEAGEPLVDLNGKELPAGTNWDEVLVLCQTPDTYWRVGMEEELKLARVHDFKSVQEYFQAIGCSILFSRNPNKIEQLGIAAQASGNQTFQEIYDFARKNGLSINSSRLYLDVKTSGEQTLRLMMGDTSMPEVKIGRPVETAQKLYDSIVLTLGKSSAAKRYPIKVTSYFEKLHGINVVETALQLIPAARIALYNQMGCEDKETCLSNTITPFIELALQYQKEQQEVA